MNLVFAQLRHIPEMVRLLLGDGFLPEYKIPKMEMHFQDPRFEQSNLEQVCCPDVLVPQTDFQFGQEVNRDVHQVQLIQVDILIQCQPLAFHNVPSDGSEEIPGLCKIVFGFHFNPDKQTQISHTDRGNIHFQGNLETNGHFDAGGALKMVAVPDRFLLQVFAVFVGIRGTAHGCIGDFEFSAQFAYKSDGYSKIHNAGQTVYNAAAHRAVQFLGFFVFGGLGNECFHCIFE